MLLPVGQVQGGLSYQASHKGWNHYPALLLHIVIRTKALAKPGFDALSGHAEHSCHLSFILSGGVPSGNLHVCSQVRFAGLNCACS